jgi:hypothetical protein
MTLQTVYCLPVQMLPKYARINFVRLSVNLLDDADLSVHQAWRCRQYFVVAIVNLQLFAASVSSVLHCTCENYQHMFKVTIIAVHCESCNSSFVWCVCTAAHIRYRSTGRNLNTFTTLLGGKDPTNMGSYTPQPSRAREYLQVLSHGCLAGMHASLLRSS